MPASFAGEEAGTVVAIGAGAYSVAEAAGPSGYAGTRSLDCSGTIAAGEAKTCTITNDDRPAHLTVIKHVVNDDGGTNSAGDFTLAVFDPAGIVTPEGLRTVVTFPGSETGTILTVGAGFYNVGESSVFGYALTSSSDCFGPIALDETKTCTFINDDQVLVVSVTTTLSGANQSGPVITVPVNFNVTDRAGLSGVPPTAGGTTTYKVYSDSNCTALVFDATPSPNSVVNGMAPVSKPFSSGTPGVFYWQAVYSGDANNAGASSVCGDERLTVGVSDKALLLAKKHVINDSGGSDAVAAAANFTIEVDVNGSAYQFVQGSEDGALIEVPSGSAFRIVEYTDPAPTYALSYAGECAGTVLAGEVKTCTITNDELPPSKLLVTKHVLNNSGGVDAVATAANFTIEVDLNGSAYQFIQGSETGTLLEVARGATFHIVEYSNPAPTYALSYAGDCDGTVLAGEVKSCTITNDDIPPSKLLVTKHVLNNSGGVDAVAAPSNFPVGQDVKGSAFNFIQGSETGTLLEVPRGATFHIVEYSNPAPTYAVSYAGDCTGTVLAGQGKSCTIPNDDIPPAKLAIIKHVVNDSGGSDAVAGAANFLIEVDLNGSAYQFIQGSETGTTLEVARGATFRIVEYTNPAPTYAVSYAGDCLGTVLAGDTKTCIITNDDIPPARLTVKKHVINDSGGGSSVAGSFQLLVGINHVSSVYITGDEAGTTLELPRGATYGVIEVTDPAPNYAVSYSADCGEATINAGDVKECTVNNDDIPAAPLLVKKHVINDSGSGNSVASSFQLLVGINHVSAVYVTGNEEGVLVEIPRGADYGVIEVTDPAPIYQLSYSAECNGTIQAGDLKVCTVTNDDIPVAGSP